MREALHTATQAKGQESRVPIGVRMGALVCERIRLAISGTPPETSTHIEASLETGSEGAVRRRIRDVFALSRLEMNLLDICLAFHIDPSLAAHTANSSSIGGLPAATPHLALNLFGYEGDCHIGPNSPLVVWSLIEPGIAFSDGTRGWVIDPAIASAMLGEPALDARLANFAQPAQSDGIALAEWDVPGLSERIAGLLEAGKRVRLVVEAPTVAAGRHLARAVAGSLGARVLDATIPAELPLYDRTDLFMRVHRIALVAGYVPCWSSLPGPWPVNVRGSLLQFLVVQPDQTAKTVAGIHDVVWTMPALDVDSRRELLVRVLPNAESWPNEAVDRIALNAGAEFHDILALPSQGVREPREAEAALRHFTIKRIGDAGTVMECPYSWNDIVLPDATAANLRRIPFEFRNRHRLLAGVAHRSRSIYDGIAVSALFCGASGTGKTMAAQVIARDLGADLIRVDLASTISKYIGETAKNLRRIFEQARGSNAIIMFDEADALFAKRTEVKDAHDRHANADTNYLLQLIEGFDGAVLLATNKRDHIEPAFMRRIRHVVEFPAAGPHERSKLWLAHLANLGGFEERNTGDMIAAVSESVELTPAQIKNAAITAAFGALARGSDFISSGDLISALDRELGKDGRALAPSQRRRLIDHG